MVWVDVPQGRALAIILPLVTLMAHAAAFLILEAVFADTWGTSWCARYNILVVVASAIGLLGAVQRRRCLVVLYLVIHTLTLTLITSVLLINVLPPRSTSGIPFFSQVRRGKNSERSMCQELDAGFGWDEQWLDDCVASFAILNTIAIWTGLVMMAAQWVVLINVWSWIRTLGRRAQNLGCGDAEAHVKEKQELDDSNEYQV